MLPGRGGSFWSSGSRAQGLARPRGRGSVGPLLRASPGHVLPGQGSSLHLLPEALLTASLPPARTHPKSRFLAKRMAGSPGDALTLNQSPHQTGLWRIPETTNMPCTEMRLRNPPRPRPGPRLLAGANLRAARAGGWTGERMLGRAPGSSKQASRKSLLGRVPHPFCQHRRRRP